MKIPLGDFNENVRRENILKPTIGKEFLNQENNGSGVRIVILATFKTLAFKRQIDRKCHSSMLDVRSFRGADCDNDHYLWVAKIGKY